MVNKQKIKTWLQYLTTTPLSNFMSNSPSLTRMSIIFIQVSEDIRIENSLTAQQHTLLWNYDKYLRIAPGEKTVLHSILFDEHVEEL